jgi:hypothetical protein
LLELACSARIVWALQDQNMSEAGDGYERSDIDPGLVGWIAVGLGVFVLAVPLAMPFVFPQSMRPITPAGPPALSADAPALQVTPSQDLRRLSRSNAEFADSYGWADRDRQIVRIPVKRAIDLLLQAGLPGWPSP